MRLICSERVKVRVFVSSCLPKSLGTSCRQKDSHEPWSCCMLLVPCSSTSNKTRFFGGDADPTQPAYLILPTLTLGSSQVAKQSQTLEHRSRHLFGGPRLRGCCQNYYCQTCPAQQSKTSKPTRSGLHYHDHLLHSTPPVETTNTLSSSSQPTVCQRKRPNPGLNLCMRVASCGLGSCVS